MPKAKSTLRVRRHRAMAAVPFIMLNEDVDADDEDEGALEGRREERAESPNPAGNEEVPIENEEVPIENEENPPNADFNNQLEENLINGDQLQSSADSSASEESTASTDYEDGFEDGIVELVVNEPDELKQLREWAVLNGIEQVDVDKLLKIFRRRLLPELPKSAKTFLGTNSAVYNILEMPDADGSTGEYVYFGIKKGLEECIDVNVYSKATVFLQINVDGISLSKSGEKGFWVASAKIHYKPDIYKPFPVAIYCGNSKPASVDGYLRELIDEINTLQANGALIYNQRFNVRIHCFVCDMPARAFLKCTKGHGGFYACERCEIHGIKANGVTEYPLIDCSERTDASFRNRTQPGHHKGASPILRIRPLLNMIFIFVLDFMHLFCEGVMRRLLSGWFVISGRAKVSQRLKDEVSRRLLMIRKSIPCEFQRKTRSLKSLAKFKATELRFILLCCGPIILINILDMNRMKNFLLLHTACRILCNDRLIKKYHQHAKIYLQMFFLGLRLLYSKMQVMNMHCVIHAADDVLSMGCNFSRISAFPFENFLGKLTKLIRTPFRPLTQVCRRLHELFKIDPPKPQKPYRVQILKVVDSNIFKLKYKQYTLTTTSPNNFVMLRNKKLLKINKMVRTPEGVEIEGQIWKVKRSLFSYPTDSKDLYMWELRPKPQNTIVNYSLNEVRVKMVRLSLNLKVGGVQRVYTMPLLHH